jgi:predicted nucleic acid-binding protein
LRCTALSADNLIAENYGRIKAALLRVRKAYAMQHQLPLYTNDRHFEEVEGVIFAEQISAYLTFHFIER